VLGAGGFIGNHTVERLTRQGHRVVGADLKLPEFNKSTAHAFHLVDLSEAKNVEAVLTWFPEVDEVFQYSADMGGAGYIFSGLNDANVMSNSALINLHVAKECVKRRVKKVFYSSSACCYSQHKQTDPNNPGLKESDAYPAHPDSEYGWEKLFSERLYEAFHRNHGLEIRIARFHNIMGVASTYDGGREKAPAAICRKVAQAPDGGEIEIWGDGLQTRSFLDIEDCIDGVQALMNSDYREPINIGSEEIISINDLAHMVMDIAGKKLTIKHIPGPLGVRGRTSDNTLCREKLNWQPKLTLRQGLEKLYPWIERRLSLQGK
jgi:nucleoside-diphosphate-sugar epimerase